MTQERWSEVGRYIGDLLLPPDPPAERREPFDLIFVDADKRNNAEYLGRAIELSRRGSVIVADNVVRGGAVADDGDDADADADASVQGVRRFYERLAAGAGGGRLSATAIQTVGVKGPDGFAIGLVTGGA